MVFFCLDFSSRRTAGGFFGYNGEASFTWVLIPFLIILMITTSLLSVLGITFVLLSVVGISVIIQS